MKTDLKDTRGEFVDHSKNLRSDLRLLFRCVLAVGLSRPVSVL